MDTITATTMTDEDATALESLRLADSALPVGTDSVSYGLEQFVAADRVTDAEDLAALLESYLARQLGECDLVALRVAHAAASDAETDGSDGLDAVRRADQRLVAVTLTREFRESATRTGNRLLTLQCDLCEDPVLEDYAALVESGDAPGAYPVVLGLVAARSGVGERRACLVACHEFATAFTGAAQRLLRLGHTDVQRVLDDCRPAMVEAVETSADRTLDDLTAFTPLVDVLSAAHERADRRLFVS